MLLDGKPVTDFTFANSTFRTTSPIAWTTPSGETAQVIHSVHRHTLPLTELPFGPPSTA